MAAISIDDLTVAYQRHPAVHHLSGTFAHGSLTAVVGPNGAGKSSLLAALVGLVRPASGRIRHADSPRAALAYLPQSADIDRSFPIRVEDVVALGHWARSGGYRGLDAAQRRMTDDALAAVGLAGFGRRPIAALSAGQFQRLLFARLLLQDARLILLDEPFNAIDARTTANLLAVIRRWHGESRTVIAVLHDLQQVHAHFPEALLLAREAVAWGPTAEVLTAANLARARQMAEAWDDTAAWCARPAR